MHIVMLGTGYVGLVSGACFSEFGFQVCCVDKNQDKIDNLKNNIMPIYEPGLESLVIKNKEAGRLTFSNNIDKEIQKADIIFIAVGTPTRRGDGHADLTYVYEAAEKIAKNLNGYTVIVTKSTVPVGTGIEVKKIIEKINPNANFDIASNPEFLREGNAIDDFMRPDRVVVGIENNKAKEIISSIYKPLFLIETPIVYTDLKTAELIKYSANAFLAVKISFINQMADLCEKVGADVHDVARGMGLDKRIGSKFLHPGPGYGGSCFPKDTKALAKTSDDFKVNLSLIKNVIRSNGNRNNLITQKILKIAKQNNLKKIGFLGVTFKANTDDMRDSSSLFIIPKLLKNNLKISYYEPTGNKSILSKYKKIKYCINQKELITSCDFVIIHSDWDEFKNIDFSKVSKNKKLSICDLRNLYHPDEFKNKKIKYYSIGRPFHG